MAECYKIPMFQPSQLNSKDTCSNHPKKNMNNIALVKCHMAHNNVTNAIFMNIWKANLNKKYEVLKL